MCYEHGLLVMVLEDSVAAGYEVCTCALVFLSLSVTGVHSPQLPLLEMVNVFLCS